MMVARFRVASRATGIRRQVYVHVYDDQEELARVHCSDRKRPYDPDVGGGVVHSGFMWPKPDPTPRMVMRLWTGQLTTRTIAHEATHAAAAFFFMDGVAGWHSRARTYLMGDHEPMAYLVGDFTGAIISKLFYLGYRVSP